MSSTIYPNPLFGVIVAALLAVQGPDFLMQHAGGWTLFHAPWRDDKEPLLAVRAGNPSEPAGFEDRAAGFTGTMEQGIAYLRHNGVKVAYRDEEPYYSLA